MRRSFQIDLANSALVVVVMLELQRVVELQDDRAGPDLQDAGLSVVADVRVLDVEVAIVAGHDVDVDVQQQEEHEQEVENEGWNVRSFGSHLRLTKIILGRSNPRYFVSWLMELSWIRPVFVPDSASTEMTSLSFLHSLLSMTSLEDIRRT